MEINNNNMFKKYKRTNVAEMRPYVKGEDLTNISVSKVDDPDSDMGMVARNPDNNEDQWYVARKYFDDNFSEIVGKSLHNTTANGATKNVKDIRFWGDGDTFKLISKASSEQEGWMKSTKAMDVGNGCVVQVTTQQRNADGSYAVAEAVCFVPNVSILEKANSDRVVVSRSLIPFE